MAATQRVLLTVSINIASGLVALAASQNIVQAGEGVAVISKSIGTAAEQLVLTEISGAPCQLAIINDDPTNYVEIDLASTMDKWPQKLQPSGSLGNMILLSMESVTVYAKANTAACNIRVVAFKV